MIQCVVFDFDGTLILSNQIKENTFFSVTKNIPHSNQILKQLLKDPKLNNRKIIFYELSFLLKKIYNFDCDPNFLIEKYTNICEKLVTKAPEMAGASNTLVNLKNQGFKIAISSATPQPTLKKILKNRGMESFFDYIYGAPMSKDDHLKNLSSFIPCALSQLILVGDSEIDQKAAKNVGSHFIGIGHNYDRFIDRPKYLLEDLTNFSSALKKLTG